MKTLQLATIPTLFKTRTCFPLFPVIAVPLLPLDS